MKLEELLNSIKRLKSEGTSKKDIVIFSHYRIDNPESCLYEVKIHKDICAIRLNQASHFAECKQIRFCTIQAFKGLEAKAVVMIDVDSFSDEKKRLHNYDGMSQAKTYLDKLYQERQQRLMAALLG